MAAFAGGGGGAEIFVTTGLSHDPVTEYSYETALPRGFLSSFDMSSVDTILYGRKTYELAVKLGGLAMFGPGIKHYVFSRKPRKPKPDAEFIREPIPAFISGSRYG